MPGSRPSTFNVVDDDNLVAQYDQVFTPRRRQSRRQPRGAQRSAGRRLHRPARRRRRDWRPGIAVSLRQGTGRRRSSGDTTARTARSCHRAAPWPPVRLLLRVRRPRRHDRRPAFVHLVGDAAVGDREPVLECRRTQPRVPVRGPGHVVRHRAAAAEPVRARVVRAPRRLPPGRIDRQPLLRGAPEDSCVVWGASRTSSAGRSSPGPGWRTATRSTIGSLATWRTNLSAGLLIDTLLGPMVLAGSAGFDGRWRTYVGVGRIFR